MRMTVPRNLRGMTIEDAPIGEVAGRSWLLMLGFIPVEYDDLRLVEFEPGRRFLERSTMLTLRLWQHERIIEPDGDGGSRVTDRLGFELRAPLAQCRARRGSPARSSPRCSAIVIGASGALDVGSDES
jgi:hypothetical protein